MCFAFSFWCTTNISSPPASPKPREDSYKDDFSSIEKEEVTMVGQEKHITVTGYNKEGRKLIKTKIILPKVKGETVSQNQHKGVAPSSPGGSKGAGNKLYSLSDIRQGKVEGIDKTRREQYLFPEEFEATFGMTKEKFNAQPKWKGQTQEGASAVLKIGCFEKSVGGDCLQLLLFNLQ